MSADLGQAGRDPRFRLGANYWPALTAMGWWTDFDSAEVGADFSRIAASGFDSVRLFLTWEDFQPAPDRADSKMLGRLVTVADQALAAGLVVIPTLFTGHMSGVNWIPGWALGRSGGDGRFRVVSGGQVSRAGLRNWYADPEILRAQALLAGEAATALAGHEAMWAWDLGNESSNCVIPPDRSAARNWLKRISAEIRRADERALITLGLHMEDLEEDRKIGPCEAATVCDFLTIHGYPIYAQWADSPTDEHLLPFLAHMTRWLGGGLEVLLSEFGLPTYRRDDAGGERARHKSHWALVEERAAAAYTERALAALQAAGCLGAMIWCYTDYAAETWGNPPLDVAVHERSFGLWRADGSPKPSVAAVERISGIDRIAAPPGFGWIDVEPGEFYTRPQAHLTHLYRRYREDLELAIRQPGQEIVQGDHGDAASHV